MSAGNGTDALSPWEREVLHHLRREFVVLGVGNRNKGDDGAGSIIAERLAGRGLQGVFDCGGVPENYVSRVARLQPAQVVFIDVVDFGMPPGSIELFGGERLGVQSASTHSGGLSPIMDFLRGSCDAFCWVLAVQPEQVGFGQGLSHAVQKAVDAIASSEVWSKVSPGAQYDVP